MVTEILGFTTLIVLVFGGFAAAVIRYSLKSEVSAKVSQRVNIEKFNDAMEQLESDMEAQQKGFSAVQSRKNSKQENNNSDEKGMKIPHVMA